MSHKRNSNRNKNRRSDGVAAASVEESLSPPTVGGKINVEIEMEATVGSNAEIQVIQSYEEIEVAIAN